MAFVKKKSTRFKIAGIFLFLLLFCIEVQSFGLLHGSIVFFVSCIGGTGLGILVTTWVEDGEEKNE
jgi:hypothetical protein